MGKYYVSCPMTGYPNLNREAFMEAQNQLEAMGHQAINPALPRDENEDEWDWEDYLWRDVRIILTDKSLNGLVMLGHWEDSRGCTLEATAACSVGLTLHRLPDLKRIWRLPTWVVGPLKAVT